jgi:DEAD/DEAH box helicase domain-containing protein
MQPAKQTGREAPTWRGGARGYRGPHWNEISVFVRERDRWQCQDCGRDRSERKLDVHHLVAAVEWDRPGHANDPENLVSLCPGCHRKRHAEAA